MSDAHEPSAQQAPGASNGPLVPDRPPVSPRGLTAAEVSERVASGLDNSASEATSKSTAEIMRSNILTRFNLILGTLLVAILFTGAIQDALFGLVMVFNSGIGILQEERTKRTLDRLALLSAPHVRVVRDGAVAEIHLEQVVLDDLVLMAPGEQIVADGIVRAAEGLEMDESLLTGESEPVPRAASAPVLSGSFVAAGTGRYQVTAVGAQAYARTLSREARAFATTPSELMNGINRILRYVTWALFPAAALLLAGALRAGGPLRSAVAGIVAALVGMVPQGLVLLTSIAFGVGAVKLAQRRVLVQELAAVEGLARVDVVCFDKTGTLTDGRIAFEEMVPLAAEEELAAALAALAAEESPNATLAALATAFPGDPGWVRTASVPFSSATKWSSATFAGHGTWVLGAPEIIARRDAGALARAEEIAGSGRRVLALVKADATPDGKEPPSGSVSALLVFGERLRPEAAASLQYFARQGVAIKVISGDSPATVGALAARAGAMPAGGKAVDARTLPSTESELADLLERESVFGRVTPHQKQAMVRALRSRGHVVAMTGDGVNDALALKLADIGVAMGSGTAATKAVAQLVLLDGDFSTLPGVVAEGRRVAGNIERVANLFLAKTVWAALLAIFAGVTLLGYPLLPRHLTVIDALTIGTPSFFLALAPNTRRYLPGLVPRVLRFAIPVGAIEAVGGATAYLLAHANGDSEAVSRTAVVLVLLAGGLAVLAAASSPFTWWKGVLIAAMAAGFVLLFPFPALRRFYALDLPTYDPAATLAIALGTAVLTGAVAVWLRRAADARTSAA
ncbi:MAG: HAD-IC family P-type ATPase [Actinomycetota bacterium]|nr:HAD-IC family P-type ATPase [Actinomycetota bacterium]